MHYNDVIMNVMASQITSLTIVCSTVYSGTDQRKHQSSASQVFVGGIHRWPVNSPHKGPVTQKMFPFDDVIMITGQLIILWSMLECILFFISSHLPTLYHVIYIVYLWPTAFQRCFSTLGVLALSDYKDVPVYLLPLISQCMIASCFNIQ